MTAYNLAVDSILNEVLSLLNQATTGLRMGSALAAAKHQALLSGQLDALGEQISSVVGYIEETFENSDEGDDLEAFAASASAWLRDFIKSVQDGTASVEVKV